MLTAGDEGRLLADFKIRQINAQIVQNSESIINQSPIVHQLQVELKVKTKLQDLLTEIAALTKSGVVSREIGHELHDSILAAANEAHAPAPRWPRLAAALSHAKEIASGLTATAGIATSIDAVVKTLGGGP